VSAHGTVADVVRQPLESLAVEEGAIVIRFGESKVLRVEAPRAARRTRRRGAVGALTNRTNA